MNYQDMLKRARKDLPEVKENGERFSIPKVVGHIEGNKTVISNFLQIANTLRRDEKHLLKYLNKELAAKGEIKGNRLIFTTKLFSAKINERIQQYANEFVICKECGKPDTELRKETGVVMMKCKACGAKHTVKSKI